MKPRKVCDTTLADASQVDAAFAVWCEALGNVAALPHGPERDAHLEILAEASGGVIILEVLQ